jgi:hypothetical protein
MKFKVFRPSGAAGGYSVIAESPLINVTGGGIQSFPFRLTVQPGDVIGLYSDSNAGLCGRFTTSFSDAFGFVNVDDVAPGDIRTYSPGVLFRFDVAASVEPDADGDGFGDITQDACPTDPARQACPPAEAAAVISKVGQSAAKWRRGNRLPKISRKRKVPVGTTFAFTLDKAAATRLAFSRATTGRRVRGRCVPVTKRNRTAHRCRRSVAAGPLRLAGHPGVNRVRFQGRLSRSKTLRPGTYALTITATLPSGLASAPRRLRFTIVK